MLLNLQKQEHFIDDANDNELELILNEKTHRISTLKGISEFNYVVCEKGEKEYKQLGILADKNDVFNLHNFSIFNCEFFDNKQNEYSFKVKLVESITLELEHKKIEGTNDKVYYYCKKAKNIEKDG